MSSQKSCVLTFENTKIYDKNFFNDFVCNNQIITIYRKFGVSLNGMLFKDIHNTHRIDLLDYV